MIQINSVMWKNSNNKLHNYKYNEYFHFKKTILLFLQVEDILCLPGRTTRPQQIVVIVRGLPGSGKTYVSKLLKVTCGLVAVFSVNGLDLSYLTNN